MIDKEKTKLITDEDIDRLVDQTMKESNAECAAANAYTKTVRYSEYSTAYRAFLSGIDWKRQQIKKTQ